MEPQKYENIFTYGKRKNDFLSVVFDVGK